MKTVYVASRTTQKDRARKLLKILSTKGYQSATDWLDKPMIKPYEDHQKEAKQFSEKCISLIMNCDIFVLLSDQAGTGMYVELGAALANKTMHNKPDIYVVGEFGANSVFTYHPEVNVVATEAELLSQL